MLIHTREEGEDGPPARRSIHGYIYWSTVVTANSFNGTNPAATYYDFSNGTFNSLTSGWGLQAPVGMTPSGSATANYYYATFTAVEGILNNTPTLKGYATGQNGGSLTFGTPHIGTSFTGLVRFSDYNDGDNLQTGTTTIHGGNITTNSIQASRIQLTGINPDGLGWGSAQSVKTFYGTTVPTGSTVNGVANAAVTGDFFVDTDADATARYFQFNGSAWVSTNASKLADWKLTASAIYSGGPSDNPYSGSGYSTGSNIGNITLNSAGSIHTPNFYINTDGTAGFKGTLTVSGTDLTASNTLNSNAPLGTTASTTIGAGKVILQSNPSGTDANRIEIDATNNNIVVYAADSGGSAAVRVKLGNLA